MTEATNLQKTTAGDAVALARVALNRRVCRRGHAVRRWAVVTVSGGSLTI
jgi:hypothetical protein